MTRARFANVSGALLLGEGRRASAGTASALDTARLLDGLFEETLLVGGVPPDAAPGRRIAMGAEAAGSLGQLVSALEAATAERVAVFEEGGAALDLELVLALTAWPERDALLASESGRPEATCALYRREPVLAAARERLVGGAGTIEALHEGVDTERVSRAVLGLGPLASRGVPAVAVSEEC